MKFAIKHFEPKKPQEIRIDLNDPAAYETVIAQLGKAVLADRKYDGNGIVLDTRSEPKIYSLEGNQWNLDCFPELADDLRKLPKVVAMTEMVGKSTKAGFTREDERNAVIRRPHEAYSEDILEMSEDTPIELRVYDLLVLDNQVIAELSLEQRRKLVEDKFGLEYIVAAETELVRDPARLQELAQAQFAASKEGLVVKDLRKGYALKNRDYVMGGRSKDWLKVKKDVTFDLIVLGLYQTEARLEQGWGCSNVLVGTYNTETERFETMAKVTINDRSIADEIARRLQENCNFTWDPARPHYWQNERKTPRKSEQVVYAERLLRGSQTKKIPFLYLVDPMHQGIVIEVASDKITSPKDGYHTCGIETGQTHSLAEAGFVRIRDDKNPRTATTTQQIKDYVAGL